MRLYELWSARWDCTGVCFLDIIAMPTLHWIGKDKVINHHAEVPFRVLEHKYGFRGENPEDQSETHSGNKIIHGDNLVALKALLPEYEGKIDCVYIDPPYNTGNEGWVYNDNVNDPHIRKWLGEVVGAEGEDLTRHDKWLCMMYPRLRLLHQLLSHNGVIFISIDKNEFANLNLLCEEVFGRKCFVADLIWRSADSSNHDSKQFSYDYNHTLVYSRTPGWEPNRIARTEDNNRHYLNPDNDPKGPWCPGNLSSPNPRSNLTYDVISPKGIAIHSPKNGWRWSWDTMKAMIEDGEIVFSNDGTRIIRKTYLCEQQGLVPSDIWWDIEDTGHNRNAKYELKKIFPEKNTSELFKTPKPTKFIDKILQIASQKDSIILDSFAGSGTTAHAVIKKNHEDGGNRKFILVELMDYAETITAERVRRVINGYGEGRKAVTGLGGSFDYYELGEPLFQDDGNLNESVGIDKMRAYIYYSETHQYLNREQDAEHPYLLDYLDGTGYFFYYEPNEITTLSHDALTIVPKAADHYVIYADICTISKEELSQKNITFKKIPRDINRF